MCLRAIGKRQMFQSSVVSCVLYKEVQGFPYFVQRNRETLYIILGIMSASKINYPSPPCLKRYIIPRFTN